jgi:hypothetical protein
MVGEDKNRPTRRCGWSGASGGSGGAPPRAVPSGRPREQALLDLGLVEGTGGDAVSPGVVTKAGLKSLQQAARVRRSAKNAAGPMDQSHEAHHPARPLNSPEGRLRATPGSRGLHARERCAGHWSRRSRASVEAAISWTEHRRIERSGQRRSRRWRTGREDGKALDCRWAGPPFHRIDPQAGPDG